MIGTIHTVHTVHTAAPPDPLRPSALDPVGAALDTVVAGLGPAGTRFRTVGVVSTVGVASRTV
ncbi:hypothetical protein PV726_09805 [Streptomyces europaeiscabiei]|uniref:hypothetical protein n=1 Tax=Streptomyces europaeiscabiei TaxID=146819 RepID=UPI0029B2AEB0|nr:hypothetical protein [Streptomyces europaeiscabiei]MDX3690608.1 hypothetical protein [Streptomyces europaeiscabiei]